MSLQTIVTNAPLDEDVKQALLERLEEEGATDDVIAAIKAALQEHIDAGFKTLGIEVDPNDPVIQKAGADFTKAVTQASTTFEEKMEDLSIDGAVAQAKANKKLETIQVQAIRAQLTA